MNILITGANGQLGMCFQNIIERNGNGHPDHDSSEKNYYIFAGHNDLDITDKNAVDEYIRKHYINVVVNCAAYTAVDNAESDYKNAYAINVLGPKNLVEACDKVGACLIHISTDYVFSGNKEEPYTPDDGVCPKNVYGVTKEWGEMEVTKAHSYLIFRTSWLYSEFGKNFVKTMIRLFETKDGINVVNDQYGCPTYAMNLAEFIYELIETNDAENRNLSKRGIYHYTNEAQRMTWYNFATYIYNVVKTAKNDKYECIITPCTTEDYPTAAERPKNSAMDCRKTVEVFNKPLIPWKKSLNDCINKILKDN